MDYQQFIKDYFRVKESEQAEQNISSILMGLVKRYLLVIARHNRRHFPTRFSELITMCSLGEEESIELDRYLSRQAIKYTKNIAKDRTKFHRIWEPVLDAICDIRSYIYTDFAYSKLIDTLPKGVEKSAEELHQELGPVVQSYLEEISSQWKEHSKKLSQEYQESPFSYQAFMTDQLDRLQGQNLAIPHKDALFGFLSNALSVIAKQSRRFCIKRFIGILKMCSLSADSPAYKSYAEGINDDELFEEISVINRLLDDATYYGELLSGLSKEEIQACHKLFSPVVSSLLKGCIKQSTRPLKVLVEAYPPEASKQAVIDAKNAQLGGKQVECSTPSSL